jgi:hypothetical protein
MRVKRDEINEMKKNLPAARNVARVVATIRSAFFSASVRCFSVRCFLCSLASSVHCFSCSFASSVRCSSFRCFFCSVRLLLLLFAASLFVCFFYSLLLLLVASSIRGFLCSSTRCSLLLLFVPSAIRPAIVQLFAIRSAVRSLIHLFVLSSIRCFFFLFAPDQLSIPNIQYYSNPIHRR